MGFSLVNRLNLNPFVPHVTNTFVRSFIQNDKKIYIVFINYRSTEIYYLFIQNRYLKVVIIYSYLILNLSVNTLLVHL